MQVTATFSKALATAALCLTLAACSSGPSDADVQAIADQGIAQMAQAMAPLGIPTLLGLSVAVAARVYLNIFDRLFLHYGRIGRRTP